VAGSSSTTFTATAGYSNRLLLQSAKITASSGGASVSVSVVIERWRRSGSVR
jgi:hypothetical protein